MTSRRVWTCDRCGTTGPAPQFSRVALATVDGRIEPSRGHRAADLCDACADAVYAAWDEWVRLPAASVVEVEP